ncbi:PqqD family protein [Paenibacillus sp. 19GGS1-52]|uniref:PqqD family protein n=1 Tax=Paenibacillus sp. 19GGS1-52 TaxID=2758563 RepID=UPI001EFAAF5E|nr:PqqD family protein [Paenibacillus sp. 19GGS1-52]ULO05919.1 PqqD family protein [Paenibacillus sp. 19GGS1-52]
MDDILYKKSIHFRKRVIGGQTILFGNGKAYTLNDTAVTIWDHINGLNQASQIAENMTQAYSCNYIEAVNDVEELFAFFLEIHAILESEQAL